MAINRNAYKSLVESVQQAVAPQNLVEWPLTIAEANRPYIPSNLSGAALSQYLNNLQNQGGANVGTEVGTAGKINRNPLSSTRKGNPSKPSAPKPSKPSVKGAGASVGTASIAEEGDWDILDEILAEGLELYGEDGLEEILTSFAVSGEMSQELADLLSDE